MQHEQRWAVRGATAGTSTVKTRRPHRVRTSPRPRQASASRFTRAAARRRRRAPGRVRPGSGCRAGRRGPRSAPNGRPSGARRRCRARKSSSTPTDPSPSRARRWANRSGGLARSPENRSPSTQVPAAARSTTRARSGSDSPTSARRRRLRGKGSDGWLRTGATTASSTIMPRAKPPVKHMPTAPTPGPPHLRCSSRANARSQLTTGLVRPAAITVNSRETPGAGERRHGVAGRWGTAVLAEEVGHDRGEAAPPRYARSRLPAG